jgi:hypothetical protein
MYVVRTICALSIIGLAPIAGADAPPSIAGGALGKIEATLSFCATVDAQGATAYEKTAQVFTQGMSAQRLTAVRATNEYRSAYDSTRADLDQVPKEQALKACKDAIDAQK